jgi:hypothetical protein
MDNDVLKMASLEDLQNELARREAMTKEKELAELPKGVLKDGIEQKQQTEFEQLHDAMFPGAKEYDLFYPKWAEAREATVREALIKKKGDTRDLGSQMYPRMAGSK